MNRFRNRLIAVALTVACALSCAPLAMQAQAQSPPVGAIARLMHSAKPAVLAIGTHQPLRNPTFRTSATGFIVGDGYTFVTNAHAIPPSFDSANRESLAVARARGAGGQDFEIFQAEVVRIERADDLAVLRIKSDAPLPTLRLAPLKTRVAEGEDVMLIGYPLGSALGLIPAVHRGIVAAQAPLAVPKPNSVQIDARTIRRMRSESDNFFYQLDMVAFPGNSGSPLISVTTGEVVGILNATHARSTREAISIPSGISYAVPVGALHALLEGLAKP
jgi:S1-C subfamily serine protease